MKNWLLLSAVVAMTAVPSIEQAHAQLGDRPIDVQIRRTSFGIPHIVAEDYTSLGYGIGYAYAQDNVCLLADRMVTVRGERSMFFGAAGRSIIGTNTTNNFASDAFFRSYLDDGMLSQQFSTISGEAAQLIAGYARGFNRYLADTPADSLPAECRNGPWVRRIALSDMYRLLMTGSVIASGGSLAEAIAGAQPPGPAISAADHVRVAQFDEIPSLGSNAVAIGEEHSSNGRGVLLGNPHFPWVGPLRFYEMHLTVPGRLNVMGAALAGFPMVQIGFNESVAWSHTVSTGTRFTLYQLPLVPGNPLAYLYDGRPRPLQPRDIVVPVRQNDGSIVEVARRLYRSHYGPMVIIPQAGLGWTTQVAYSMRDANIENVRLVDQWLDMARAGGVPTLRSALERNMGVPWVNTVAADDRGRVLYADISVKPNVDTALFTACTQHPLSQALFANAGLVLLDGSTSGCEWRTQNNVAPDNLPPSQLPWLQRRDYVQNSNDSFWLSNPEAPLTGFSPVVGRTGVPQSLRTRVGLDQIADRLSNADGLGGNKFSDVHLQQILFGNRNHAAELALDTFLPLCRIKPIVFADGAPVDVSQACTVLTNWQKRNDVTSVGPHVFREWWMRVVNLPNLWATPFNPADPANTPRDLNVTNVQVRDAAVIAFARAVRALNNANIPMNAMWGSVFYQIAPQGPIPMHGGLEAEGVYNKVENFFTPTPANPTGLNGGGYTPIIAGSSYIQTVAFDGQGPVAHAILTYSQSSHTSSPHYADQTSQLFSREVWHRLPFRESEIAADPNYSLIRLQD
jgi:acyl-homoserine-lactone acylase